MKAVPEKERALGLVMMRNEKGKFIDLKTSEPLIWIDLRHGQTQYGEVIYLRVIKCPFVAANPLRFYVDLCGIDMDKELFTNDTPDLPERFCQIIRRRLDDPQYGKHPGVTLKFITHPKKYVDGTISSVDGVLRKDVALDGRGKSFPIPAGEALPVNESNRQVDRGEYEENYEDDFMIGIALWLPVDSNQVRGMRLIRNDLGQLRLYDARSGAQLDEEAKHTYRMVFTYKRRHLIGNFAHFLRTDAIGTRIPHRLTLPLERPEFQVPPLGPGETSVPVPPNAIPTLSPPSSPPGADLSPSPPLKGSRPLPVLPPPSPPSPSNPTGLEPQFAKQKPFSWADYEEEEGDALMAEEPRYSLDSLTNAISKREREQSPENSPASDREDDAPKYRKSI